MNTDPPQRSSTRAKSRRCRQPRQQPGELFVEYQLAAKAMRPDRLAAVAAYGDYAPWYIGTAVAYERGGYETGPDASNVARTETPFEACSHPARKQVRIN
jgi:hypothetical protein